MMLLDDQLLEHAKFIRAVRLAGGDAIHFWLGLRAFCAQKLSDGHVADDMIDEVRGPSGKRRDKALDALKAVGLIHDPAQRAACSRCKSVGIIGEGLWMHDYLEWSDSRDEVLTRRENNRDRQRKSRGLSHRDIKRDVGVSVGDVTDPSPPPNLSLPQREEIPQAQEPGTRIRPVADPLGMAPPYKRPDVLRVQAAWKQQFGYDHHRFRGYADPEALLVATAIDVHSEAECMLVLAYAPSDGMVSGRDDQRKTKHESLGYIFGNEQTFARILRAAQTAERAKTSESPSDRIARLKAREGAA